MPHDMIPAVKIKSALDRRALARLRPDRYRPMSFSPTLPLCRGIARQQPYNSSKMMHRIMSATSLRNMMLLIKNRQEGSLKYQRLWRNWSDRSIEAIRYHLSQNLPTEVDEKRFAELRYSLGVAADEGVMPSFQCAGSRSGYALNNLSRARLLADHLFDMKKSTRILISIGGGPAFDYVGSSLVATFLGTHHIEATIFDYEEGWKDLVTSMADATATVFPDENHSCRWGGKCDINVPLSHPSNSLLAPMISNADLVVCQYCISENAMKFRASKLAFFADAFTRAQPGTVFLFTETTPRVWPDFIDLLERYPEMMMQAKFQRHLARGKIGPQLVLTKLDNGSNPVWSTEDEAQCTEFRRLQAFHDLKMSRNWERRKRKVRGSKLPADEICKVCKETFRR